MDRRKLLRLVSGIITGLLLIGVVMGQEAAIDLAAGAPETDAPNSEETEGTTPAPAVLKTEPQTLTVQAGQPVTLPCEIERPDSGVAMWRKGGRTLTSGARKLPSKSIHNLQLDMTDEGRYNLQIKKVRIDDKGEYTCTVEQEEPVSVTHTIVVTFPPSADVQPNELSEFAKGDAFSITCIARGQPEPQIKWTLKDENGHQRDLPQHDGHHNITVESLSRADAGDYQCVASNGIGEPVTSQAVKIVITYPPEVTSSQALFLTTKGRNATLHCAFSAYPTGDAKATWYRIDTGGDGAQRSELHSDGHHDIQTDAKSSSIDTKLHISNVQDEDLKKYVCHVDNGKGQAEHEMELSAHAHPERVQLHDKEPLKFGVKMRVKSHSPVKNYKITYREINETAEGTELSELVATEKEDVRTEDGGVHIYERVYIIQGLRPQANYSVKMAAENEYGWSRETDLHRFSLVAQPSKSGASAGQQGPTGSSIIFCRSNLMVTCNVLLSWLAAHLVTHHRRLPT